MRATLLAFIGQVLLAVCVGLGLGSLVFGQAIPVPRPSIAGGAPSGATYITQTADGTLGAEQALGALSTGIMRVATTTGVVTSLTDSAGIAANLSDEIGSGAVQFAIRSVEVVTTTKAAALTESQEVYTNTGDGAGASVTLPNDPTIGTEFLVAIDAAQTLTILANSGESLRIAGDACAVSITSNVAGSVLVLTAITGGSGAQWFGHSGVGTWVCNS